jgi:hypothetical protein
MASAPESAAEEHRGVSNRGLPRNDRTIEPRQAAQVEAARLKALAPSTYRHPDGSPPERQDFEAFSRQYEQMANERHVWRFAQPDGSTYETSWQGLGTGTTAQAWADLLGHRVIGQVIPGPTVEGTPPRDAERIRREAQPTRPPPVQAEPLYSAPPLVQAEGPFTPFNPLPWPYSKSIDDNQRGIANKIGPPTRSKKKSTGGRSVSRSAVSSPSAGTWGGPSISEQLQDLIIPPDPKRYGKLADPDISRELRQMLLAADNPAFAKWLLTVLEPTVSNFLINLHLERNDVSQLEAAGIIFEGQSQVDRGNALENGSQRNAFRHTFGQALIVRDWGRESSEYVGFAHEDLPAINTDKSSFNDLFEADSVADLLNNEIGRRIAERLGTSASNLDVAWEVLNTFKDKGLYVATFGAPGEIKISRRRLTEQQFTNMIIQWNFLNEDGKVRGR